MTGKKLTAICLTLVMALGMMSGCGSTDNSQTASGNDTTPTVNDAENNMSDETETALENTTSSEKTLVVYYSASGNTRDVAETIAEVTGGDLFEIQPVEPYTSEDLDWTNNDSRVSREHDDESLRDVELVSTTVDNWDSYSRVYLGYPIWWGIAAWPVDNFVKNNDFTGKTVIPFCTAASSGIGQSGDLLEEMAGTGDWLEGDRFRRGASESDIKAWIDSLGL